MPLFLLPLFNWLKPYLLYILLAGAVIITVLSILARVKQAGVLQERVETMKRTIDAVKERKEVERENAKERRDTGVTANEQLRKKWQRD